MYLKIDPFGSRPKIFLTCRMRSIRAGRLDGVRWVGDPSSPEDLGKRPASEVLTPPLVLHGYGGDEVVKDTFDFLRSHIPRVGYLLGSRTLHG